MQKVKRYILLSILVLLASCGGDSANKEANITRSEVVGTVKDFKTGQPLAGVNISNGEDNVQTDINGDYKLEVDGSLTNGVVIRVDKDNYVATSKVAIAATDDAISAILDINLLPVGIRGEFNPQEGFTVSINDSPAQVLVNGESLVLDNGNTPIGNVFVELTAIDPALDIDLMPGNMRDDSNNLIASLGALALSFEDEEGNSLNLAEGQTATIRIPASTIGELTETIPLYYFNEITAEWIAEGMAALSEDRTYYEGRVSRFSTWNADYLYENIFIKGCVENENGERVENALVNMGGFNFNGTSSVWTNANGEFNIATLKGGISFLVASTSAQVSNTIKIGENESTDIDVTVETCLILGDAPLTARLTWGRDPVDLDTHIRGPNNYHIYFSNKGSLITSPFAKLDIDDTSSFGPEVFTALSFPEAGTYHYYVKHYTGSSNILASGTRVEVTLDGRTRVFTPLQTETPKRYWGVFDIIVANDGGITILANPLWTDDVSDFIE